MGFPVFKEDIKLEPFDIDDAPAPEEQKAKVDHELARMLGLPLDEGEDDDVPDLDTMLGRGT